MDPSVQEHLEKLLSRLKLRDPQLQEEVERKAGAGSAAEMQEGVARTLVNRAGPGAESVPPDAALVAESIVRRIARPVLLIRHNAFVPEFAADSEVWRERLKGALTGINAAIPSVGRIEVAGLGIPFVGTGWLVADDILVTNRHVASEFAKRDGQRFVFRSAGIRPLTAQIDFFEEHQRPESREFPITEVLWIAGPSDPDIAFVRVARSALGKSLTRPIPLLAGPVPAVDRFVAVIGYPARDDGFPDRELMMQIFGDVFDKKRLAPGQIIQASTQEIEHDCSTLGGNSGSVVLDLESGQAIGLHFAGQIFTANFAVAAATVSERLNQLSRGELVRPALVSANTPTQPSPVAPNGHQGLTMTASFNIPIEITVKVGGIAQTLSGVTAGGTTPPDPDSALEAAKAFLQNDGDVLSVSLGYRFRRGWITKEKVVVIEVKEKLANFELRDRGKTPYPEQFLGMGVDVRTATQVDRLRAEGVEFPIVAEAVNRGNYVPPTNLRLQEVNESMRAIFHVSPDSGFPNLRAFLGRTQRRLVATMYEAGASHIRDAVVNAVRNPTDRLRMITDDQSGIPDLVQDLHSTLGNRFDHQFASAGGNQAIFPTAYHIKVAVRDRKEFWLSSGNWKDSGQPNIEPAATGELSFGPLREHNREWHAIVANANLAAQFDAFIEYDFREANRVAGPEAPARIAEIADLFVPIDILAEARGRARYFKPLDINKRLRIQPLLSPDNYVGKVLEVIEAATTSILFQNQSFNLLAANEPEAEALFQSLVDKQETCEVKIIFRDAREFGGTGADQRRLLERLQDFGFNMDNIRLQKGCHTKGIVVDSSVAIVGSHNWTNTGMLFNRDASLIVFDAEVAAYFEKIFRFDWEFMAKQEILESNAMARVAAPNEATPPGMKRVSMSEFLATQS